MISWIVASHDQRFLDKVLGPTLLPFVDAHDDELIIIRDQETIAKAYTQGQGRATHLVKCYLHHDVRILDLGSLRLQLIDATATQGLVGLIGARSLVIPWWHGYGLLGSVRDGRMGVLNFGAGGECAVVDGLLLATREHIVWDESWPGWHGYEYDACQQMHQRGASVWCLSNGHQLVSHDSDSPYDLAQIDGWHEAVSFYQRKWALGES